MKKEIAILFSTGLLCLGVFFAIFSALQNKTIFEKTLENIAHTYERIETKESYKILKTPNPYVEVSDEKLMRRSIRGRFERHFSRYSPRFGGCRDFLRARFRYLIT